MIVAPGIGALVPASRTTPSIGLAGLDDDRAIRPVIAAVDQAGPRGGLLVDAVHLPGDDLDPLEGDRRAADVQGRQPVPADAGQAEPAVGVGPDRVDERRHPRDQLLERPGPVFRLLARRVPVPSPPASDRIPRWSLGCTIRLTWIVAPATGRPSRSMIRPVIGTSSRTSRSGWSAGRSAGSAPTSPGRIPGLGHHDRHVPLVRRLGSMAGSGAPGTTVMRNGRRGR